MNCGHRNHGDTWRQRTLAVALSCLVGATSSAALAAGNGGAAGDALAPANMLSGPSLHETGKVSPSKLEGDAPSGSIRGTPKLKARPEPQVAASDTPSVPATQAPPKMVPSRAVQQQITVHLRELDRCHTQVAREKHLPSGQVSAGAMVLRFTIGLDGAVTGTEVVEKTPVDPAVMECVRQTIGKWTFPVPDKGPLPVERRYRFKAAN
jgi:hypothetical protein